ncbi:MAG TPA: Yip1 family protein, partial [Edaphobacter sp.]
MTDVTVNGTTETGLSEVERVVNTFVAPSKTFTDIRRNASWWLPFLILVVMTMASAFVVDRQVGFTRVAENQIHQSPKQEDQFNQLPDDQKAARLRGTSTVYRYTTYGAFVFVLIFVAIFALVYWASFNFGLGAQTTYKQMFAVWMYASLPKLIVGVLAIIVLLFGGSAESYNMANPVGTNLGYYVPDAAPWIKSALSF